VIVFTKNPDLSLGKLSLERIELILEVLADRTKTLGANPEIRYVLPFENRGAKQGVTLSHNFLSQ
jgi:UDPglucose--hexose-1-phosphate uridylyltransferase